MSTTQRSVRLPVTTPATSPTREGRTPDRFDADRQAAGPSRRRVAALATAALLVGGLVGVAAPILFSGTTAAPAVPVQEVERTSREHLNRIPLGPDTRSEEQLKPQEHLDRIPLGPAGPDVRPAESSRADLRGERGN